MLPRVRYLKRNAGTEAPTALFFFDCETVYEPFRPGRSEEVHELRLWTACYVRREGTTYRDPVWHRGETAAEFWDLVEGYHDRKRPLWAFSHNVGVDLTWLKFWDELERGRWTAGPCARGVSRTTGLPLSPWRGRLCLESRPTFLVVRHRAGLLKIVDTVNFWAGSLAELGEKIGRPKWRIDFQKCTPDELYAYCQNDTDVIRHAVCELVAWWVKEDCGTFQFTAPMLAMTNWRHTCTQTAKGGETTSVRLEQDSPARKAERECGMGGWVEPFYLGYYREPVVHLDCNSLYPYLMLSGLFPRARVESHNGMNLSHLAGALEARGGVAGVLVDTRRSGATYPIVDDGTQVHATGNFFAWLAGPELARAVRSGHVTEVFEAHLYSVAPLFADWAATWLSRRAAARAAGDRSRGEFCNLILHALGGKWAQKGDVWVDCTDGPVRRGWGQSATFDHDKKRGVRWRWVAGHTQRKIPGDEPVNAFPAIWAFLTAMGREFMKDLFARMPYRSVLYTNTDSIICTLAGFRWLKGAGLVHPTEPGKFKVLGRYPSCRINGPNWYRLGKKWTRGGFWGKAKRNRQGGYYADVWQNMGSLVNANPNGQVKVHRQELESLQATVKNDADTDGWRRPYRYTPVDGMCDPAPRRVPGVLRPRGFA
jgi:DNA polymerase type B, organellar and viral